MAVFHWLILICIGFCSAQTCHPTKLQRRKDHSCPIFPPFLREAFTLEKVTSNGTVLYQKQCCDSRGVELFKAYAKGCQTTGCIIESNYNYDYPCSTFKGKFIVDGEYTLYEESLRDNCIEPETLLPGVAAVCCPPNSKASLLLSVYGAEPNEFPHQARLQSGNEVCGGTVYNQDYVITAAHCVTDEQGNTKDPKKTHVTLGTNIANIKSKVNVFPIEKIIPHEHYSLGRGNPEFFRILPIGRRIYNDIAVLKLAKSIDFANQPHIRALEIPPANFTPGDHAKQVVIIGWGTTDTGMLSEHLQKANLIIHEDHDCFKPLLGLNLLPYPNTREFSNQLLCVGGIMNGETSPVAGKGDSGGPAICRGVDGWAVHCGVTSFGGDGDACTRNMDEASCKPSVYVEVSHFRDWIQSHAGEQDPESLHKVKLYGDLVPKGEALHQVHVTTMKGPSCGGTLVAPDVVVTAGHCVFTSARKVRHGLQIMTRDGDVFDPSKDGVTGMITYARYILLDKLNNRKGGAKGFLESPYVDDIAVIKLDEAVPYNEDKLAKLPASESVPEAEMNATELSIPSVEIGGIGKHLMRRDYRILDSRDCQRRLDRYKVLGVEARFDVTKTFCGVERYSGGSICDRELGGGLICKEEGGGGDDRDVLCGIQTFRLCDSSMPSAFLNVGRYMDIIKNAIESS